MTPAEVVCIGITSGNTRPVPASASAPSLPTKQVSIGPPAACARITVTLGAPRRSSVGGIGASGSTRVRGSMAGARLMPGHAEHAPRESAG
jgi:hypothetical protein